MAKHNSTTLFYLLLLVVGGILGAIVGAEFVRSLTPGYRSPLSRFFPTAKESQSEEPLSTAIALTDRGTDRRIQIGDSLVSLRRNAIVRATELVEPSVVGIVVTQIQAVGSSYSYEDFFDLFFSPRLVPKYREVQNMGSGFIFDERGFILTNNHVIEGAKKLYINFADGRQLEGEVVGTDPYSDIAVVAVKGSGSFPSAKMGNSDKLMIGEWVIAIGNPFLNFFNDAQPSVTVGVVSAKNRNFARSENVYYENMIQTDAAINPGNSGGPLVDALGEVIGINAFIYTGNTKNRGSIGIGFAIPINTAKRIARELVQYGKRRITWTGIAVQDLDRSIAMSLGITSTEGVIITDLEPGSSGAVAGLQLRDVIVRIGKRKILSHEDLDGIFLNYFPGDTIGVHIVRGGISRKMNLVLQELKQK